LEDRLNPGAAVRLLPGESLQFKLSVGIGLAPTPEGTPVFLRVDLVAAPVNPVPQSAYALLRWQTIAQKRQVECVRFAWGPEPARIELICPEDLRSEIVRRRAVFQWQDSVRKEILEGYAIQKITTTGSTHFPGPVTGTE
jgi:hypothetical protein